MKQRILLLGAVAFLTACASVSNKVKDERVIADQKITVGITDIQKPFTQQAAADRISQQIVSHPFIAGKTTALSKEAAMPEMLRKAVPVQTAFQVGPVNFSDALVQIGRATGLSISATQDALLPASSFAPRVGAGPVAQPSGVAANRVVLPLNSSALWNLLDDVARQTGTNWRPTATGAEFFRVETRIYQIAVTPQTFSTSASMGRNASQNSLFDSVAKTSFETKDASFTKTLGASIEALLTQGGRYVFSPEDSTIIVTDTPASHERVASYVAERNKLLSQRVRLVLEAVEVIDRNGSDVGVDWNILYSKASAALSLTGPSSTTPANAGNWNATASDGRFKGTSLAIKALSDVGFVTNHRIFPFLTTNGKPVTQAVRSTFNYVDNVQVISAASSNTSNATTAPTVQQKDETVGTFVTITPNAKGDGTVFVNVSFDQTSAQPLVPFTVGSASNSVTVQQKTIDGTGVLMEFPMRSGQSIVLGGIETVTSSETVRRLAPGMPLLLGGGDQARYTKSRMVLMLTAVSESGM